jgi:pimeloyl-ACP methyl ester carboxylesterase
MQPDEVTALGELAGEAIAGVAGQARDLHEGIAGRVFAGVGPAGEPVRLVHDRIAARVYKTVHRSLNAMANGSAKALSANTPSDAPSMQRSPAARMAIGALNGAFGDALEQRRNALALKMTLRNRGRDVELTSPALRREFPDATGKLVVFAHGLCETDEAWRLGDVRHIPYGMRLRVELGYTPLYIRYNTGRHISENGRELSALLDRLTGEWPTEIHEIALIGHSMGGLVGRSACHYAEGHIWPRKVRHVFTLGSPHTGAPLERAANAASHALARLPETRTFAKLLNRRSAGIKDLRYGYLVDDDWFGHDPDEYLRRIGREIPFLTTANHYFVCATLNEPLGRIIGDMLVMRASAWGQTRRGERMRFPVDQYRHFAGLNHFQLLNHPAIYHQIHKWLAPRKALPAPRKALPASVQSAAVAPADPADQRP